MPHIVFNKVSKRYSYSEFSVFDELSFELEKNEKITLLIDRQSGKTTLCKLLTGLEKTTGGQVFFDGQDVATTSGRDKNIAYLSPDLLLFENKTVFYNLSYPLKIRKIEKSVRCGIAFSAAEKFGISEFLKTKVKKISFLEKLKVALARLTVRNVDTVLVDSLLDACSGDSLKLLNNFLSDFCGTVIVLTENLERAVGRILLISDSKVVCEGNLETVREHQKKLLWLGHERGKENNDQQN